MPTRMIVVTVTFVVAVVLGITGLFYLDYATGDIVADAVATRNMIVGMTFLGLGVSLFIAAMIMAFICSKPSSEAKSQ